MNGVIRDAATKVLATGFTTLAAWTFSKRAWLINRPWAVATIASVLTGLAMGTVVLSLFSIFVAGGPYKVCRAITSPTDSSVGESMIMPWDATPATCYDWVHQTSVSNKWQVGCLDSVRYYPGAIIIGADSENQIKGIGLPTANVCKW